MIHRSSRSEKAARVADLLEPCLANFSLYGFGRFKLKLKIKRVLTQHISLLDQVPFESEIVDGKLRKKKKPTHPPVVTHIVKVKGRGSLTGNFHDGLWPFGVHERGDRVLKGRFRVRYTIEFIQQRDGSWASSYPRFFPRWMEVPFFRMINTAIIRLYLRKIEIDLTSSADCPNRDSTVKTQLNGIIKLTSSTRENDLKMDVHVVVPDHEVKIVEQDLPSEWHDRK